MGDVFQGCKNHVVGGAVGHINVVRIPGASVADTGCSSFRDPDTVTTV